MSLIQLSDYGSTPFERLLGHVPEVLDQWGKLESCFFHRSTFSADFLEQVRRALAFHNQCQYCMAKAGPPDQNPGDIRLAEALRFANQFSISHDSIDEADIVRLKTYFSDAELIELTAFCGFICASQKIGAVMKLEASGDDHKA